MSNDPVTWLGRALGTAARRSLQVARVPRRAWQRTFSGRKEEETVEVQRRVERRGDARLVGARLESRRRSAPQSASSPADLSEALSHPDSAVRVKALRALGRLSKQRAEHLVAPMLHDPHVEVRVQAAQTASELKATSAVFSLIAGLEDDDERVREACYDAVYAITERAPWADPLDAVERAQTVIELRGWWKKERLALLLRGAKQQTVEAPQV